ncbi:MAG: transketolase C-terminal domain-containing protein, partial [Pseudomonadota bacterium]
SPFHVPDEILALWRAAGARGRAERDAWSARLGGSPKGARFAAAAAGAVDPSFDAEIAAHKRGLVDDPKKIATRKASQLALDVVNGAVPQTIGGSADLTGSNNTQTKDLTDFTPQNRSGRYIRYGVREHGMAAAMNGIALHGGLIPYGGTFLVFTDYCRPSIRLSALMGVRAIYVMTHDSIGLGEDGPTHQPVEHLASLRAIPGLCVYRPADAVETAECWQLAINDAARPSVISLTRQGVEPARLTHTDDNLCARGAYILADAPDPQVVLIATGSEIGLALAAQNTLACEAIRARVVSAPSFELFAEQPADYREAVLGAAPRVGVEAAVRQGWDQFLRPDDDFIGMAAFGASGPGAKVYEHFGITASAVADAARALAK